VSKRSSSLSLLTWFMHQPVQVDTSIGVFKGVLQKVAVSRPEGIGSLLLETGEDWLLIKSWLVIKW